jgi:SAM-dependent methyltransferase
VSGSRDDATAAAFAESWNRVGSVYSREQFVDWFAPIDTDNLRSIDVLELGFGNGSLLAHVGACRPRRLAGVELGDTLERTRANLSHLPEGMLDLRRGDLTTVAMGEFDLVYCIGVLHHLDRPEEGFEAVLRHTKPGGRFHCWVYAREGNAVVRWTVEPLRRLTSRLPWPVTKFGVALPLAFLFFAWAKVMSRFPSALARLPLGRYTQWIAESPFRFFHHVAFDQLVTPRTRFLPRTVVERWLRDDRIAPESVYVIFRNGNSWKFGGRRRPQAPA